MKSKDPFRHLFWKDRNRKKIGPSCYGCIYRPVMIASKCAMGHRLWHRDNGFVCDDDHYHAPIDCKDRRWR